MAKNLGESRSELPSPQSNHSPVFWAAACTHSLGLTGAAVKSTVCQALGLAAHPPHSLRPCPMTVPHFIAILQIGPKD